ncbi:MAG: ATP-binding cassette domain-containing protein [Bacteroidales bacterium]|nr:ATP-binding cassette domain-containing protein [Bacteroidales bacterium]
MITIQNLDFSYGKSPVIKNLNWQLETGKIHGLVGLNGAGKSTLFNLIAGWLKPSNGTIMYNEIRLDRSICALMETNPQFYPMIKGQEYLDVFKLKNNQFDISAWNNIFKLPLNEVVDNYSTGMKKRLDLMGILAMNREILILDEPFNGLDFEAVRLVQQVLPLLASKGKTIIISSHIAESLTAVCNSISLLRNGEIGLQIRKDSFANLSEMIDLHGGIKTEDFPL